MTNQPSGSNFPPSETTPLIYATASSEEQPKRDEVAETKTWLIFIATMMSLVAAIVSLVLMSVVTVRTYDPPPYASLPLQIYQLRRTVIVFVRTPQLCRAPSQDVEDKAMPSPFDYCSI
jgi:hypothetical protein